MQEHTYRLVIASFERDVEGAFRVPSKRHSNLRRFKGIFCVSDENKIIRACLVFNAMTQVSYAAPRERTRRLKLMLAATFDSARG